MHNYYYNLLITVEIHPLYKLSYAIKSKADIKLLTTVHGPTRLKAAIAKKSLWK